MFDDIAKELAEQTLRELAQPPESEKQTSRNWTDPEGYRFLFPWSNAVLLRFLVRLFTESLPKCEYRRKAQVDDAARSTVRNIEEGFKRATTKEYLEFLGFSQGSLEEVKGDVRELAEDGFLRTEAGSGLVSLGIDLRELNLALRRPRQLKDDKGKLEDDIFTYQPITILYPPLAKIRSEDLTYEIFIELINKTDFLLRGLVISLEKKLNTDHKGYQIDRIRLNRRAREQ